MLKMVISTLTLPFVLSDDATVKLVKCVELPDLNPLPFATNLNCYCTQTRSFLALLVTTTKNWKCLASPVARNNIRQPSTN
jgi:hypothetical protein